MSERAIACTEEAATLVVAAVVVETELVSQSGRFETLQVESNSRLLLINAVLK